MSRLEVVRYAALIVPVAALWLAVRFRPSDEQGDKRELGALLLAGIAAFVGLGVLHELSRVTEWWTFAQVTGSWRGFPVDLWLGWAVLWGPLPVALRRHLGLPTAVMAAAWVDVVAMPAMEPVVVLGDTWLWGEFAGLVGVLVPATLLGRWTADSTNLPARVTLQMLVFTGLVFWLLPTVIFTLGDGSWTGLTDRSLVQLTMIVQLAAVLALPGIAAVQELATQGRGTPYPWDPPSALVTTGPYAYVANPMQLSATLLLLLLAVLAGSWFLAAAAVGAVAFHAVLAGPHEREQLHARFGDGLDRYRHAVRPWWPRWRPNAQQPATLFIDEGCNQCRQFGVAVAAARPVALEQRDARAYPGVITRLRYQAGPHTNEGIAAAGRALEHLNLLAAAVGWTLRLPGLRVFFQLIADTFGPAPHRVGERTP